MGFNFGSLFPGIELSDIQVISEQLENTKVAIGQQQRNINPSTLESNNLLSGQQVSPLSALQASLLSGNVNMASIAAAIAAASSTATSSTTTTTSTSTSSSLSTALNQLTSLASPVAVNSTATSTPTTPTLTSSMGQQQQMALLQTVFKQVSL